jgi:hypothetical protein
MQICVGVFENQEGKYCQFFLKYQIKINVSSIMRQNIQKAGYDSWPAQNLGYKLKNSRNPKA